MGMSLRPSVDCRPACKGRFQKSESSQARLTLYTDSQARYRRYAHEVCDGGRKMGPPTSLHQPPGCIVCSLYEHGLRSYTDSSSHRQDTAGTHTKCTGGAGDGSTNCARGFCGTRAHLSARSGSTACGYLYEQSNQNLSSNAVYYKAFFCQSYSRICVVTFIGSYFLAETVFPKARLVRHTRASVGEIGLDALLVYPSHKTIKLIS